MVTFQPVLLTLGDIIGIHTIRDMIIDLRIDIIVLNLSYFMLCDDCQIATYYVRIYSMGLFIQR